MSDIIISKQTRAVNELEKMRFQTKLVDSENRKLRLFSVKKELERIMNKLEPGKTHVDPKKVSFISKVKKEKQAKGKLPKV